MVMIGILPPVGTAGIMASVVEIGIPQVQLDGTAASGVVPIQVLPAANVKVKSEQPTASPKIFFGTTLQE